MLDRRQVGKLDPMCGKRVSSEQIWASCSYIGQDYNFCSQECFDLFRRSPEYFITLLAHDERGHLGILSPPRATVHFK